MSIIIQRYIGCHHNSGQGIALFILKHNIKLIYRNTVSLLTYDYKASVKSMALDDKYTEEHHNKRTNLYTKKIHMVI